LQTLKKKMTPKINVDKKESITKNKKIIKKTGVVQIRKIEPRLLKTVKAPTASKSIPQKTVKSTKHVTPLQSTNSNELNSKIVSQYIKKLYGHNRYDYAPDEYECKNMESSYGFIEKEEVRSKNIALLEDKIEFLKQEKQKKTQK
ncbi:hypothetical protein HZS_1141, partial [Henneguya salminicola]